MRASEQATLKVLIADDHPLILQGLRRTLEACDDIDVVGEAHTGAEVLPLADRRRPDVVLLDMRMPEMDGIECARELKRTLPEIRSILLSASEERASVEAAEAAGASAYLVKSVTAIDLPAVVRQVAAGYTMFQAPSAGDRDGPAEDAGPELTERETAILSAAAGGLTTKAIGKELWVSEHTVKFHLTNIYRKLGVSNRSGAIRYAFEHGLVDDRG
jgi:two-component system nitrate/nitrite response regulator NarL